ncbi:manganese efflux pump MntP family protein [Rheinheimera sp. MMS21-TC3]|uniref:manganese efflux pump MntP n=1 Tax=Rheinheimera sp. MMS21-TC3 TaxID=3072790 RepID=UPI0028C3BAFE|nr:manganese efflux pump MntP family protein [Rheinheimera sp. MMS21-TC3]WNO59927.1 manganese efflux pump MntP family protein [Rheinheimera sp. MMS21-TC3]
MFEVIVLALALSMDAFAVSIGLGAKHSQTRLPLGLIAGIYFGLFQGIMPLIGYAVGIGIFVWIEVLAPWIAFVLLTLIGGKMIYESRSEGVENNIVKITHKVMLILALATSIDAMAAGFSLTILQVNPISACFIIGITTLIFSWLGVVIGKLTGSWLESKAELLGGIVLILIGLKILIF